MRLRNGIRQKLTEWGFTGYRKVDDKVSTMGIRTEEGLIMAWIHTEGKGVDIKLSRPLRGGRGISANISFEDLLQREIDCPMSRKVLSDLAAEMKDVEWKVPSDALNKAAENHAITKIVAYPEGFVPRNYSWKSDGRRVVAEVENGVIKRVFLESYDKKRSHGTGPAWVAFSARGGRLAAGPPVEWKKGRKQW